MSGTIWLISEDETDKTIVEAILRENPKTKIFTMRVKAVPLAGKTGGISRLVEQLEKLIQSIQRQKTQKDCIAVLYDTDESKDPKQLHQKRIREICAKYQVKAIPARHMIESWLLADSGVCHWLKQKPKNWDEEPDPKQELDRLLKNNQKRRLSSGGRQDVINHLKGDGDEYSDSLKQALNHLKNAPCTH